jgi:hypothetical protein
MDMMRILQSLEQFLFEVMAWLVFYPRTMWFAITRPLQTMSYADGELDDADDDRYSDTLNPPLFLALTMALSIGVGQLFGKDEPDLPGLLRSTENLLAFDILLFSLFPLTHALRLLRRQGKPLDRKVLRSPFYQQCYVVAPFALLLGLSSDVAALGSPLAGAASTVLFVAASGWFLWVQTRWFKQQAGDSTGRSLVNALSATALALLLIVLFALVMVLAAI